MDYSMTQTAQMSPSVRKHIRGFISQDSYSGSWGVLTT